MHSKSDNIEILINDQGDEVIKELFQLLPSRYLIGLETLMKGSKFALDSDKSKSWWIIYRLSWLDKKQKGNNKSYQ